MKITQKFNITYAYKVFFTSNVLALDNPILKNLLICDEMCQMKVAFVIDMGVFQAHPTIKDQIEAYLKTCRITQATSPLLVRGGEGAKNCNKEFNAVLQLIDKAKIDRHSYLIAVGGGAVLDMVGFAASVGHRGIRHIRIPTTVLSQNDSGVGVKNGINYKGKKNFLGVFSPPVAVINDAAFLITLDDRDWRSGIAEAVKVALIKDAEFFNWLEANAKAISRRDLGRMSKLIYECARLHCHHIAHTGDPFESGSSRPLDFGHWAAHKLEQLTEFEIRHGEAVAIGIGLDLLYSKLSGLLDESSCKRALQLLANFGFDLFHPMLLTADRTRLNPEILKGLEEFREHLGGELTITMVNSIGHGIQIHSMHEGLIEKSALALGNKSLLQFGQGM